MIFTGHLTPCEHRKEDGNKILLSILRVIKYYSLDVENFDNKILLAVVP